MADAKGRAASGFHDFTDTRCTWLALLDFRSTDLLSLRVLGQDLLYALDFVIVSFAREDIRSVYPGADADVRRDAGNTWIRRRWGGSLEE